MKKLLISLACLLSFAAFAQDGKTFSDPHATTRTLNGSFTAISVSSGVDLYLSQGNEESIAVSASDEKYLSRFKTEVVNGTLKIYYDNNGVTWTDHNNRKLKAWVSFKTLEKLQGSAGASVTMRGILNAGNLDMKFSSGSVFEGQVNAQAVAVDQNSGSEISISGKAEKLTIEVSSGALFKGYDMAVEYCDAKATSGADVRITINKELNAKANSGGGIRYKGAALIRDVSVNSGGLVKRA